MASQKIAVAGVGAAAVVILATAGLAQAQTQPAAAQVTHGAAVPSVCIFSSAQAVGGSTVGQHVSTRMQQIVTQVNSELQGEKTTIDNEAKAIESARATTDQATLQKRAIDLQARFDAWQRKAAQRQREVEATEQKAFMRVAQEMDPVVKQVYQQRQCGLLLDRNAVMLANPSMDITPAVITGVNAKIQTFNFDRERLDQPAPAAQPKAK